MLTAWELSEDLQNVRDLKQKVLLQHIERNLPKPNVIYV